ncbi:MAG: pyruvate:ferredoxin (flavodoxin) oxidoreductase, partial [Elusimicrobia bacterium]|nr:pyruvate:ferredoxin (flavodoxin) oxidoreductase [Elusimicrobiota bacterium]
VSHLRFGPRKIRSTYLVDRAQFVACHQFVFVDKYDMLSKLTPGGTFLLNSPYGQDQVWDHLPKSVQRQLIERKARFYVIDAVKVAKDTGMGGRINTIMQTCFFAISGVLPKDTAIELIKDSIKKAYGNKGEEIVKMNFNAVDHALANLHEVKVPSAVTSTIEMWPPVPAGAPEFVHRTLAPIIDGRGDELPVSAFPVDGTFPVGTARWEKRNIALEIPVWDPATCIQCNKCVIVCPHSVIRAKVFDPQLLKNAPATYKSTPSKNRDWAGLNYTIQVAPEDCTGCALCVDICPAKNKSETRLKAINMASQEPLREPEKANWDYFLNLPEFDRRKVKRGEVRASQLFEPLFEFSGACSGCGETPYLKLMSQLFGDRAIVANATGCSSIYGGNLPTTPWTKNAEGRGPAWSNSLFEDNAEFGLGFRLSVDKHNDMALELLKRLEPQVGGELVKAIADAKQDDEPGIYDQRERVAILKEKIKGLSSPEAKLLLPLADYLVRKSVWIVGGDGWAYDIGFGGLDHVMAAGRDVNILILDTEVYSNTGGQASKATPRAAVAKFAMGGKGLPKKDLARIAMTYGHVYVAQVAMGARDEHTLRVFLEAEAYRGPSVIIAYSHCIAHGINMTTAMRDQKEAVTSGHWLLFRYNPLLAQAGKNPLVLDSTKPTTPLKEFLYKQNRFKMLTKSQPEDAQQLLKMAEQDVMERWGIYERLAAQQMAPAAPANGTQPETKGQEARS